MNSKELIEKLGGPTKVAGYLGLGKYGAQRVANWVKRGIPYEIQLKHPKLRTKNEKSAA